MAPRTSLPGGGRSSAVRALCQRTLTSRALRSELRAPLQRVLEFDAYCVNTCDLESGVITSSVGDGLSPEHARLLFALEAEGRDINSLRELHRGTQRVCSIWHSTNGTPERSQRMQQIFLPLGFADELRAALSVGGACFGYLHLFRRTGAPPFAQLERARVASVVPSIAAALRRAAALEAAGPQANEEPSPAVVLLDASNRLVRQSATAPATVTGVDTLRITSGLSHVLQDLASRARVSGSSRATLLRDDAAPRSLSAVQVGDQTAVVVDRLSHPGGRSLLATLAALTPRERAVSDRVARGHSNRAIAAELGISLYTVKDHVKAVLSKTRCASRAELAARWSGANP